MQDPTLLHSTYLIEGAAGKLISADVTYNKEATNADLVIFVHGFKGFKDWGHFPLLAERFAREGFVFVKFNFSHNGTGPSHLDQLNDLDAFAENNYGKELFDLNVVIGWAFAERAWNTILSGKIALIGHSRGGGIAILTAAEDTRINKLVTWASVSDFLFRNKKETLEIWKKNGVMHAKNVRTGQKLPMNYQFIEDLETNALRYDIGKAMRKLTIPCLIVHGTQDEAVPAREGQLLKNWSENGQLLMIKNAGHTFGVSHPFQGNSFPPQAEMVIFNTIQFLKH